MFFHQQSTQVELVLLIFRRLSEDIHVYQSGVPSLRRREMAAALNEQSKSVFAYLINNLEVMYNMNLYVCVAIVFPQLKICPILHVHN